MATPILQVLTQYCDKFVNDINLRELAETDRPLYARTMFSYLRPAIGLFTLPDTMQEYLVGDTASPRLIEPKSDDTQIAVDEDHYEDFTIELGDDYKNYELFTCRLRTVDNIGGIVVTPVEAEYDAETGTATIHASYEHSIPTGSVLDFDFYTDGYFVADLSVQVMTILGKCFQVMWQEHFNEDWLSMVSKVEDKSFFEQNRANKEKADTERLTAIRTELAQLMRRYDQNLHQLAVVKNRRPLKY